MFEHALNVLEDFKEKNKANEKATLFLLAYDMEKAYDTVQEYTIRASLERFNLPELFISFVLCNLNHATSCFMDQRGNFKLRLLFVKAIRYLPSFISASRMFSMPGFSSIPSSTPKRVIGLR